MNVLGLFACSSFSVVLLVLIATVLDNNVIHTLLIRSIEKWRIKSISYLKVLLHKVSIEDVVCIEV